MLERPAELMDPLVEMRQLGHMKEAQAYSLRLLPSQAVGPTVPRLALLCKPESITPSSTKTSPADITESDLIKAFFETYPFPCHYYSLTSGGRHIAFEVHSPENVSNILANPFAISNAAIFLLARLLPTESELRSQQVLQLRHVPYLKDERTAFEAFEPVIAPYGETVDLIRDTNTPHPLAHNGNYQLIVKLADLTKAAPPLPRDPGRRLSFHHPSSSRWPRKSWRMLFLPLAPTYSSGLYPSTALLTLQIAGVISGAAAPPVRN
ncbi:hypothetical protein V1514DRAFT_329436 [Lipomyces japonicus]|uniref:uncharacterized protein n=1 Tax=Lipomyces japonicus TaxID=56871 RepID=UPI0034CD4936